MLALFFVLPAIIVACGIIFRTDKIINLKLVLSGALASTAGFITNTIVGKYISQNTGEAFSNFSYTLYGLVVGGKGWTQAKIDHPLAREGSDIYKLAYHHFLSHPFDLLKGMVNMWNEYLPPHQYHAYQFVEPSNSNFVTQNIHRIVYLCLALGLIWCFININKHHSKLTLFLFLGYSASIPFVPPIDAGLRVYAATVGILSILPAVGISFLTGSCQKLFTRLLSQSSYLHLIKQTSSQTKTDLCKFHLTYAFILVILATIVPVFIKATTNPPPINKITCSSSHDEVYFHYNPGNVLEITSDSDNSDNLRVPFIRSDNIQSEVKRIELRGDSASFSANKSVLASFNLTNKRFLWITAPSDLLPQNKGIIGACGKFSNDATAQRYGLLHIDEVKFFTAE